MLENILFLLLTFLFLSCAQERSSTFSPPVIYGDLGVPVTSGRDNAIEFYDENLTVTFVDVLADGRCPAGMSCTATLPVEVELRVRSGDSFSELVFSAYTGDDGMVVAGPPNATPVQEYGGYTVALEQVLPYPTTDGPPAADAYQVTVRVTRSGPRGPVGQGPGSIPARLGEPATLGIGQGAVYNPPGAKVTVVAVTDDRCPPLTICESPPIVVVDLDVEVGDQVTRVTVGGVTDDSGHVTGPLMETAGIPWAQVGDLQVELTGVTPYPRHLVETAPAEFAVTFVLRRVEGRIKPTPAATATPTADGDGLILTTDGTDIPVLSIDAAGNPVLCVSELALTQLAAGASTDAPVAATELPIGAISLPTQAAGDDICAMFFDSAWHMADTGDLDFSFEPYFPASGAYWIWDDNGGAAVAWEAAGE